MTDRERRATRRSLDVKRALTAALRSYSRNKVIRKRLPGDLGGGLVFCSPDALLSTWKPGWQSHQALNLFEWARRFVKPGDVVWDVGANQGLFSFAALAASGASGRVVAFEPDPFLAGLMYRTRNAQAVESRMDILPIAVAGDTALAEFSVATKDRALNHLTTLSGNPHAGGERERITVMTVSLAWLATQMRAPDIVKVDVEGGELEVLRGAGELLLRSRPTWIIEVAAENSSAIADILRKADYRMYDASAPENSVSVPAWNTLAVPAERRP